MPPPTVAAALVLIASARGAGARQAEDAVIWTDTITTWLPPAVAAHVLDERLPWTYRRSVVARLLFEGSPLPRPAVARLVPAKGASDEASEDVFERMAAFDDAEAIARVASVYGCSPVAVVTEWAWPLFLLWLREASRVQAQRDLSLMTVRALPYMKDDEERGRVLDRIRTLAGALDDEVAMTVEEKIERGKKAAAALRRFMGVPEDA